MLRFSLFLSIILLPFCLQAQNINTPSDIDKIMKKSDVHYVIDSSSREFPLAILPLTEKGWFQIQTPEGIQLIHSIVRTQKKSLKYQKKGKKSFLKGKHAKAFNLYMRALSYNEDDIEVLKQLANCKMRLEEYDEALYYLERAFEINKIDFELNQQLSECHRKMNQKEQAIQFITRAHILNRNDAVLLDSLISTYIDGGLIYQNWTFDPQFQVLEGEGNEVVIAAQKKPWQAYAACTAVWTFESEHRERMKQISSDKNEEIKMKECLLNALIAYEKTDEKKEPDPAFETLSKALVERHINDFIDYEITARLAPNDMSSLSTEKIDELVEYVIAYKTQKLIKN